MVSKNLKVIVWIGLLVFCLSSIAWSQNPMLPKTGKKKIASEGTENISLPKDLNAIQIDHIIAGLSDEQVRRLLINELKAQAQQETTVAAKPEGIAGFIHKIRNLTGLLQARIELLRSGGEGPREVSGVVAFLGRGERGTKTVASVILSVAAVLAGALLIEWLFVLYTAAARRSIITSVPSGWVAKIGALSSRALLDFALDRKAGIMPSDRLYIKRIKQHRDVAVLVLVDLSTLAFLPLLGAIGANVPAAGDHPVPRRHACGWAGSHCHGHQQDQSGL